MYHNGRPRRTARQRKIPKKPIEVYIPRVEEEIYTPPASPLGFVFADIDTKNRNPTERKRKRIISNLRVTSSQLLPTTSAVGIAPSAVATSAVKAVSPSPSRPKPRRLMDLPVEIRNQIWVDAVLSASTLALQAKNFRLPKLVWTSRQIFREALPFFFTVNHFNVEVRSNWCVRNQHFHTLAYWYYQESGALDLADRLYPWYQFEYVMQMRTQEIRLRSVDLQINCACCKDRGRGMATLELRVKSRKPYIRISVGHTQIRCLRMVGAGVADIFGAASDRVEEVQRRERFNGFTLQDLEVVAGCCRYVEDGHTSSP